MMIKVGFRSVVILAAAWWGGSCTNQERKLPIYGEREVVEKQVDGRAVVDTVYHTIPDFAFVNQDGDTLSQKSFEGKIYLTDFFFTSCPTICPVMKKQMKAVYEQVKGLPDVMILSHSIDPAHDTPEVLKKYKADLGAQGAQWQFVTGDRRQIYQIGEKSYMVVAKEDSTAEGGFLHSGHFILVDKNKRVRGTYDGTKAESVQKIIDDITLLRKEQP